jgi:hypothetical protein
MVMIVTHMAWIIRVFSISWSASATLWMMNTLCSNFFKISSLYYCSTSSNLKFFLPTANLRVSIIWLFIYIRIATNILRIIILGLLSTFMIWNYLSYFVDFYNLRINISLRSFVINRLLVTKNSFN